MKDLYLDGVGEIAGGLFHTISISGSGKCKERLKCLMLDVSGMVKLTEIEAETIDVSGMLSVSQCINANTIDVSGMFKAANKVKAKNINISGMFKAKSLVADEITVSGALSVNETIEAESLKVDGSLKGVKLINVGYLDYKTAMCEVLHEIEAETVKIDASSTYPSSWLLKYGLKVLKKQKETLNVSTIEADEITLKSVRAKLVRGRVVHVESGCHIEVLEYHESYELAEDASVKHLVKL